MDLYIFRHAQTKFAGRDQKDDTNYGSAIETAEIIPEGIPAIEKLGKYLRDTPTDFNTSSTYLRCRQTVEIVEKFSDKEFSFDPRLHDHDQRSETLEDVAERISEFHKEISMKDYTSVAICSHGYPISMIKMLATKGDISLSKKDLDKYPPSGVLVIVKNKKVEYVDFN